MQLIEESMEKIKQNTCLKYRKWIDENDFVDIQNEYGEG